MTLNSEQQAQQTASPTTDAAAATNYSATVDASSATVATSLPPLAEQDAATVAAASARQAPQHDGTTRHVVDRGLTTVAAPLVLRDVIRLKALCAANRFRVIRTFDVAAICFPERPYKASLSAAQRAMRRLVKDGLLLRYRTDRHQHVYGLTQRGVKWLDDHGIDAAASVRRVADMTNPEHLLWSNFIVSCCEVRGIAAHTESELLRSLNRGRAEGQPTVQGLLSVKLRFDVDAMPRVLRPDAVAYEPDGCTWFEIDRSKRGRDRELALQALIHKVGLPMANGRPLRRVVVLAKSERIHTRALALARELLADPSQLKFHRLGNIALCEVEHGMFEVWGEMEVSLGGGRTRVDTKCLGHVVVQLLPTWLPRLRIDNREQYSTCGWFSENYLPYRRPAELGTWPMPASPLWPPR